MVRDGTRIERTRSLSTSEAPTYSKYLSSFQVEKFTYLFNSFFDIEKNNLIEKNDILALCEKMRVFCNIKESDEQFKNILDVHKVFYECLRDQVTLEKSANSEDAIIDTWEQAMKPANVDTTQITLNQWLNMWGKLCYGAAGLDDFPIWVQLLPNIFFDIIDADKTGEISFDNYRKFYDKFVGIKSQDLESITKEGYRVMTAGGDYKFDLGHFKFCFANFLLGRSLFGPGKYIFGVFDNTEMKKPYQVVYSVEEE